MPKLRNISSETLKVGGWQVDQIGSGIPLDVNGAAQHQVYTLAPGEEVEFPAQIANHPIIEAAVASGNFEIREATLVPGGEVEVDPSEPTGAVKKLELDLAPAQLTAAAGDQTFGMGALPKGSAVLHAWAEIATQFSGGGSSAVGVELGSLADPDAIASSTDLFTAAGLVEATLLAKSFPLGIDVQAKVSADVDVNLLTAGSAKLILLYVVLD